MNTTSFGFAKAFVLASPNFQATWSNIVSAFQKVILTKFLPYHFQLAALDQILLCMMNMATKNSNLKMIFYCWGEHAIKNSDSVTFTSSHDYSKKSFWQGNDA